MAYPLTIIITGLFALSLTLAIWNIHLKLEIERARHRELIDA